MTAARAPLANVMSPAPRAVWNEILASDSTALVEHGPAWIDTMRAAGGFTDASRLYELRDGRRFVIPLVQRRRLGPRAPMSGFPNGWGIGGVVGDALDPTAVSAIVADLVELPAVSIRIRPNPLQAEHWAQADTAAMLALPRRCHVVDLAGTADDVWMRFRKGARRSVKKATDMGVDVKTFVGGEMLDVYYRDLYMTSVERWAQKSTEPARVAVMRAKRRDPLSRLQTIGRSLGERFRLYLAYVDGEPVAGNVVLCDPNTHATRAAMNEIGAQTHASYALDWAAIRDACARGSQWYQMGESGFNESLSAYKEKFGAVGVEYSQYRHERLPITPIDSAARGAVKKLIGFREP
jgi:hypothetical protein